MKPFSPTLEFGLVFDRSGCNVLTESKGTDIFGRVVLVGGGEDARGGFYYCEVCVAIVEIQRVEIGCFVLFFPVAYHTICFVLFFLGEGGGKVASGQSRRCKPIGGSTISI